MSARDNSGYRDIVEKALGDCVESAFFPELDGYRAGKVREMYDVNDDILMITTDRLSAFDRVLPSLIPYKGAVLTGISEYTMTLAQKIVPSALKTVPDPNVMVQKRMTNVGVECIVRGHLWGSLAGAYESGIRNFCGIDLPGGLLRYQELPQPIFTPTTKAETGHDENITFGEMCEITGNNVGEEVKRVSMELFEMFNKLLQEKGIILLDTKFEFGVDSKGVLHIMDEVVTPDSSRFCMKDEWESKSKQLIEEMESGTWKNVTELVNAKPGLKIEELSKQFVRDILLDASGGPEGTSHELTDGQVVDTALKYIWLYETITDKTFMFADAHHPTLRIPRNLRNAGLIIGGAVQIMAASVSDGVFCDKLIVALEENHIPYSSPFYSSAHKNTGVVLKHVAKLEKSMEPLVIITVAGRSNGLGPVVAGNSRFPVIACNPYKDLETYLVDIHSSLRMPSDLPMAVILDPKNAVLFARRILDVAIKQ